jgi:hypothetical protein
MEKVTFYGSGKKMHFDETYICDGVLGFSLGLDEKSLTHLIAEIVHLQYVQRCNVLNTLKRSSRFSFQGVVHAREQLCQSGERWSLFCPR